MRSIVFFLFVVIKSIQRLTFLAVCLHGNPVLDKEPSSLNSCELIYFLWLWSPLASNWRCSHSHLHLRRIGSPPSTDSEEGDNKTEKTAFQDCAREHN